MAMEPDPPASRSRRPIEWDTKTWGKRADGRWNDRPVPKAPKDNKQRYRIITGLAVLVGLISWFSAWLPGYEGRFLEKFWTAADVSLAFATVAFATFLFWASRDDVRRSEYDRLRSELEKLMDVHFVVADGRDWRYAVSAFDIPLADLADTRSLAISVGGMTLGVGRVPLGPYADVHECGVFVTEGEFHSIRVVVHIPLYGDADELIARVVLGKGEKDKVSDEEKAEVSMKHLALVPCLNDVSAGGASTLALSERWVSIGGERGRPTTRPLLSSIRASHAILVVPPKEDSK